MSGESSMRNWTSLQRNSLAFVAGAIAIVGFAPLHWFIAVPLSIVLIYLLVNQHLRYLSQLQFFYGLGFFSLGISWVFNSVFEFGTPNIIVASIITLALIVVMAAMWALPWLLASKLLASKLLATANGNNYEINLSSSVGFILFFTSVWVLSEWTRSWLLSGFPWLFIGYTSIDSTLGIGLKQWAPWGGIYLVSFATVLASILSYHFFRHLFEKKSFKNKPIKVILYYLLALLFICLFPLLLPTQTQPNGNTLNITLVQPNTSQHQKWQPEYRQRIINSLIQLSTPHKQQQSLIIWPEAAIPLVLSKHDLAAQQIPRALTELQPMLRTSNSTLLTGAPTYNPDTGLYNNSLVQLGKTTDYYDKVHLVPFGEYVPLQWLFDSLLSVFDLPLPSQRPGKTVGKQFNIYGQTIAANICYEIAFPDLIAQQSIDANLLVTVSNDAWFGTSWGPIQHMQMAQMRALEANKPLLRATNNGITALVDFQGNIRQQLPQFTDAVLTSNIQPRLGNSLYTITGSYPILLLCTFLLIAFAITNRK